MINSSQASQDHVKYYGNNCRASKTANMEAPERDWYSSRTEPPQHSRGRRRRHRRRTVAPTKTRRKFTHRTIVLISVIIVLILILIIGLAAGLSTRHSTSNLPLPSNHGGGFSGDLTYYAPGLGACGVTSSDSDAIVAISYIVFDAAQSGTNPNTNPLCGLKLRARREDRSVDLTVVDRCTGCKAQDLDVTVDTFAKLADVDLGRVSVEWAWLEDVP